MSTTKTEIHVIVISSVLPEPSSAGQIVLFRHLVDQPGIKLHVLPENNNGDSSLGQFRHFIERCTKTRFFKWACDLKILFSWGTFVMKLPEIQIVKRRTLVLTVAHGERYLLAQRFAKSHGLPLVSFFHDWWPDIVKVHDWMRPIIDWSFRNLYKESSLVFCVSRGMMEKLGDHPNARVLLPYPGPNQIHEELNTRKQYSSDKFFRILYFGNLFDYGAMLQGALEELRSHPTIRLEVRGGDQSFTPQFRSEMTQSGNLLPFRERGEIGDWLSSADAFLVPQLFEAVQQRRMETNFPSKMLEYAQFGKPIVVWGPEYGSAVKFAKEMKMALIITDPDPVILRHGFERLAASPDDQSHYADEAKKVAEDEFNPERIHEQFIDAMKVLIENILSNAENIDRKD